MVDDRCAHAKGLTMATGDHTGTRTRRVGRLRLRAQVAVVLAGLVGTALAAGATSAQSATPGASGVQAAPVPAATDKIRPALAAQLAEKGRATYWIRFSQKADLTAASKIADWDRRGQAVYDALVAAAKVQGPVLSMLKASGATYTAFWATDAIRVEDGSEAMATSVAARPEVAGLYATTSYQLVKPLPGIARKAPSSVEWGVRDIKADQVWSQYGDHGEGITVASIDTGVQYDHPALVDQYRGNNGDGTFTHDYNWFDAAGNCPDAPCDLDAHGTHTMGTMVGDDGGANQIGVAPGAKWIEANGCCDSDETLINSGQWMLAPTDLAGQDPDVSKRPDIINNSWGTTSPSTDPFMEDVEQAWAASGIFGVWANGNIGPDCATSGAPGSRTINYSVGAYDSSDQIADFSSRGPGQDGQVKPNISAPGVDVRSSVPGDGYDTYSGTSMATPHVAGAVALLWSAAPSLIGDIAGTEALLDQTAVDTPDDQCGGTPGDNNVYGQGRLDALALVQAAPTGDTGILSGTVTAAATGDPLAGADVEVTGPYARSLTTDADGAYSVRLPAGTYTLTVTAFGFLAGHADVALVVGGTTKALALTAAPSVTVTGRVVDGSGHGYPLYTKVTVDGPGQDVYTSPVTGRYSLTLPAGATYSVSFASQYPGYVDKTEQLTLGSVRVVRNAALSIDQSTCSAAGYAFDSSGISQSFDGTGVPAGWTVQDNIGNGEVWTFEDPGSLGNLTGGDGGFAVVDSDFDGPGGVQDTSLVSPVVDLSGSTAPVVSFKENYRSLGDSADVDVSLDGGATWQTVLHQTADVAGASESVPLPMAAGHADVQVRFHYHDADFAWWWEVDDVFVGNRTCDPVDGGLVTGTLHDRNTGAGLVGGTVTSVDRPSETGTSVATPDDPALGDGFYWLFSGLTGHHRFRATAAQYQSETKRTTVTADAVDRLDYWVGAGHLTVSPGSLDATLTLGTHTATRTLTISNDGTAPATVQLGERSGGFVLQRADGSTIARRQLLKQAGAPLRLVHGTFSPLSEAAQRSAQKSGQQAAPSRTPTTPSAVPTDAPWTPVSGYPNAVMDSTAATVDGDVYSFGGLDGNGDITASSFVYDPGTTAWTAIAPLPDARENPMAAAIDGVVYLTGGWLPDGTQATTTLAYDPGADSYTQVAAMPDPVSAAGRAVLDGQLYVVGGCTQDCGLTDVQVYDPADDTWTAAAAYPEPTAHVACGAIDGTLYCAGGSSADTASTHTYAYDPGADAWTQRADLPIDLWGMGYTAAGGQLLVSGGVTDQFNTVTNQGFAYDPASDSWTALPNSDDSVYRGASTCGFYRIGGTTGGFTDSVPDVELLPGLDDCGDSTADVPWLSVTPSTVTVDPGQTVTARVTMDADVAQPGVYTAGVQIGEDVPGSVAPVAVTMTVTPPAAWGKLTGTVSGSPCVGAGAPLPGATVQVDSWAGSWTYLTGPDGSFASWINAGANPLTLIAAKDGYQPQTRTARLIRGGVLTSDFDLAKVGCG